MTSVCHHAQLGWIFFLCVCFFKEELLEHINVGCPWLHFWGLRQACDTVCGIQSGPSGDHKRRQEDKRVWEDGGVCVFPRSLGLNWFKVKQHHFEIGYHLECSAMSITRNKVTKFLKVRRVSIQTSLRGEVVRDKKPACMSTWKYVSQ